jgi:flagellin
MGMQIQTNVAAINAQRNLNVTGIKMGKVLEKLSSGYRINRAADDAAGLGISEKMRAQIRGNAQAIRNAQDGISMVQTAEGAMDEVHSILQRMRELAVQAANTGAADGDARAAAQAEVDQLVEELDRISDTTRYGSTLLLDGSYNGTFQVGANSGETIAVAVGAFDATTLGVGALDLQTDAVSASAAIDAITDAVKDVSTARAGLGAVQNRFEHTIANLSVAAENLAASESRIRDTDMAHEMVAFTRAQILTQAGTAMLAQANQAPQGVLQLLR